MNEVTVITPESLNQEINPIVNQASNMLVQTASDVEDAKDVIRKINAAIKTVEAKTKQLVESSHKAWKEAVKLRDEPINILESAKKILNKKIGDRELEQRRLKDEADRKVREEAEAERGRILLAAQKKLDRIITSSGKIEDQVAELQKELAEGENTDTQREFLSRQLEILQLKLDGQRERAAEVQRLAEAAAEAPPVVASGSTSYERTKGVRVVLVPEVADKMAVIKAVAAGQAPESAIAVDVSAVKKLVNMGVKIPGIITREDTSVSVR